MILPLVFVACDDDETNDPGEDTTVVDTGDADVAVDADTATDVVADTEVDGSGDGPTEYEFTACDEVSSDYEAPDGLYFADTGCVGYNPLSATGLLCPEARVIEPAPTWEFSGQMVIVNGMAARYLSIEGTATVWMPQSCVDNIGGGECTDVESLIDGLADDVEVSCPVDETYGGCDCAITAVDPTETFGTATISAGLVEFSGWIDGTLEEDGFAVGASEDDRWIAKVTGGLDLVTGGTYDAEPTACETYCTFFMAGCNGLDGVTGYDDLDGCMTACADFPVSGNAEDTSGDSVECRVSHLMLAAAVDAEGNAATHCPHAMQTPAAACVDGT